MSTYKRNKNDIYTLLLRSADRLNKNNRVRIAQDLPPNADDFDRSAGVDAIPPVNHNPNDLEPFILDTRTCQFYVDWGSVLPHVFKRFKIVAYFTSENCVQADTTLPNVAVKIDEDPDNDVDYSRAFNNTSDGNDYQYFRGSVLKILCDGLYSSNVFDSVNGSRSSVITLVRRRLETDQQTPDGINNFIYETISPQLVCPVVDYPTQSIFTVRICGDDNRELYPESFLKNDYATSIADDSVAEADYNKVRVIDALPQMADWFLVLTFTPCE